MCRPQDTSSRFQSTHPVWGATPVISAVALEPDDFNPRTPCGVRPANHHQKRGAEVFQSTHPVWGATTFGLIPFLPAANFNPRTPCGVRHTTILPSSRCFANFNPRTPCGVRHLVGVIALELREFQSTHPVWGATTVGTAWPHTPWHFNPRTPCGVRPKTAGWYLRASEFQSTHPVWGATSRTSGLLSYRTYFNPRTPCGVRPKNSCSVGSPNEYFNPRTPCGVRRFRLHHQGLFLLFQSTHPVWGATSFAMQYLVAIIISIHAPRVGCDSRQDLLQLAIDLFQSTHPVWGATASKQEIKEKYGVFQSTHPVWGATHRPVSSICQTFISIHAPRVGCDLSILCRPWYQNRFQSTHPVWGATSQIATHSSSVGLISIHAPRVGCDYSVFASKQEIKEFQSTHPVWGATAHPSLPTRRAKISIHAPRVGCDCFIMA